MASAKKKKPARRIVSDRLGVSSLDVAQDGRIVIGENGGYRVACFDAAGVVAWNVSLARAGSSSRYQYETQVLLDPSGEHVLALMKDGDAIVVLDLATGKRVRDHMIPKARTFALTPDGKKLILRTGTETTVLAYPSLEQLAYFDAYCNQNEIAVSPDGKWFAVAGHEIHVFDAQKLVHRKTFEPPESPWSMCATASGGQLLTGDQKNMLRVYDAENDFGKVIEMGKNRSPTITAIAVSHDGKWIATGNELGTVYVHDASTLAVAHELKGHDASQPDTGSKSISALAFLPSGELVVSAPPKKELMGLTVHAL